MKREMNENRNQISKFENEWKFTKSEEKPLPTCSLRKLQLKVNMPDGLLRNSQMGFSEIARWASQK